MSDQPVDEELALLRAGTTAAACAKIVALHGALVKSACFRVLRDEGLAEDAAQETFMLLMKKAQSLPAGTSLAGWLYHAACRTALNHRRAAMRRRVRENSVEAMNVMIPDTQPNLWTEIEPHLDEAMLALPERQRDLVVQCYFQNQSQRSAAAALGCSESSVSRELSAAIEAMRRFFAKRRVAVSGVALAGLLPAHAATASMAGGAALVTAMMAAPTTSTLMAALMQSKLLLTTAAVIGTVTMATVGYFYWSQAGTGTQGKVVTGLAGAGANGKGGAKGSGGEPNKKVFNVTKQGKWEGSFKFTSAMALDERKKEVLLEADPDARYALLQKMGVRISRAAFDQLIAKGLDASVAPWRNTLTVLTNKTDAFDNYLMAWGNEDPLAALDWVTVQPDDGIGLRRQLLFMLSAKKLQPEELREWMNGLTIKARQRDVATALEAMADPGSVVARMGTGGNDGFLVDLAMLQGGAQIDWAAFGQKLAAGKSAIVARAMRLVFDEEVSPQHYEQLIQELGRSADPNISMGAVAILRAARGDAGLDFVQALQLAEACDRAGMSDFRTSIFEGWAAADPQEAMHYASGLKDLAGMRDVIRALETVPDEATLLSWMDGARPVAKNIALVALYGRDGEGTFARLQRIMQSPLISDEVEAAKEVMRTVPLPDAPAAAAWLKQLPAGKNRQELAAALVRRLAEVDPGATLDLIFNEGLSGKEFDVSISQAVVQFAAQNDLARSMQFIQQITDAGVYGEALGELATIKFAGHPQEAFAFLQANTRGDWQPAALRMLSELYYNKLGNIDANAAEILKLDLARLGPEVAPRASNFVRIWIDHNAPIAVPMAWTQQLPGNMGRETRLALARSNELKLRDVEQFQVWTQTAPISAGEREQLQAVLGRRLGGK